MPGAGMWHFLEGVGAFENDNGLMEKAQTFERIMMTYGDFEREKTARAYYDGDGMLR